MTLSDIIIVILVAVILGASVRYIRKAGKQGKCIGCPHAKECSACKKRL